MENISIPVYPVSEKKANTTARKEIESHLISGGNILIFPAGRVAQKLNNEVTDMPWRNGIAQITKKCAKEVIPVFIDAENSNFLLYFEKPSHTLVVELHSLGP